MGIREELFIGRYDLVKKVLVENFFFFNFLILIDWLIK